MAGRDRPCTNPVMLKEIKRLVKRNLMTVVQIADALDKTLKKEDFRHHDMAKVLEIARNSMELRIVDNNYVVPKNFHEVVKGLLKGQTLTFAELAKALDVKYPKANGQEYTELDIEILLKSVGQIYIHGNEVTDCNDAKEVRAYNSMERFSN